MATAGAEQAGMAVAGMSSRQEESIFIKCNGKYF